jgi:ABC-type sugar transport system permease subunit
MSDRDPLHLWPLAKGFLIPFIPLIFGILYAVNVEGRAGLEVFVLSLFSTPLLAIGLLIYEVFNKQRSMMYGTIAAILLMMLVISGDL